MTSHRLELTFIGNRAKTCSVAGILNRATRFSSHWREAWARAS
jgi:hypothetical protein